MKINSQNMHFSYFFRSGRPNRKKAVKMTSQSPSGTLQAGPREGEIDQLFAPRASQGRQQQFSGRPGPSQSLSGTAPGRLRKQGWRPRAAQRPPGKHFGRILDQISFDFRTPEPSISKVSDHMFSPSALPLFLVCCPRSAWLTTADS